MLIDYERNGFTLKAMNMHNICMKKQYATHTNPCNSWAVIFRSYANIQLKCRYSIILSSTIVLSVLFSCFDSSQRFTAIDINLNRHNHVFKQLFLGILFCVNLTIHYLMPLLFYCLLYCLCIEFDCTLCPKFGAVRLLCWWIGSICILFVVLVLFPTLNIARRRHLLENSGNFIRYSSHCIYVGFACWTCFRITPWIEE